MRIIWDVLGACAVGWTVHAVCLRLGPTGYGTPGWMLAMAGIGLLGITVGAMALQLGGSVFKVDGLDTQEKAFPLLGLMTFAVVMGFIYFGGQWIWLLVWPAARGGVFPEALRWLFQ